ncbi:hypothetical protein [Achromobacter sp. DH1f]|uniref:hypothetical protein n=1 Tax=Achromobacter sp. DH1f TaxID=1397275 RepID=UPI000469A657|nr:hypothetical protein [Achromobacter sp. DH1f]
MNLAALKALWANKPLRYVLAAAVILVAGLVYRGHLIDYGAAQERTAAQVRQDKAVSAARDADALVTARVTTDLTQRLRAQQESHDRVTSELQTALADSDLRRRRADDRIVGLLNEAAGLRSRLASAAARTRGAAGTAPPDSADPAPGPVVSDADVLVSVTENYAICNRNSERLAALQTWYEGVRTGKVRATD